MRRPSLAIGLLVILAACTAGTADPQVTSTAPSFLDSERDVGSSTIPPIDPNVPQSDIAAIRQQLFGASGESEAAQHRRHEEIVQSCMRDQGFTYEPIPFVAADSPNFDPTIDPGEFAREYGYGRSTLFEVDEIASAVAAATFRNPNDEIRAGLSQGALAAYFEALFGPPAESGTSEDGGYIPADPMSGCLGDASAVYGGIYTLDISTAARDALLNVERFISVDPEVRSAQDAWATCMRAAGYEVSTKEDAVALTDSLWSPLLATSATKSVTTSDSQGNHITVRIPDLDPDRLAEAQRFEIQVAVTDFDCDRSGGLSEAIGEARIRIQEQLISQWYGELTSGS